MSNSFKRNLYVQFTKNKKIKLSEFMYLVAFSIYLINAVLDTTMFREYMSSKVTFLINILVTITLLLKIFLFDKFTLKQLMSILLLFFVGFTSFFVSHYNTPILLVLFIAGAKDISFEKIIKTYFYITLSIIIISMISAELGIIKQIVFDRDGQLRYAFGSGYCTDFAAHIFYLIISYYYINYKNLSIIHPIIFILLGLFTYTYSGARLDSACIFIVAVFSLYIIFKRKFNNFNNKYFRFNQLSKLILIISVPLLAVIAIVVTIKYTPFNSDMYLLNHLLSNRLEIGQTGIINYGFKLFGQQVFMVGNGGKNEIVNSNDYFFIDSSYLYISMLYGTLMLIILSIYYVIYNKKRLKNNDTLTPTIILIIAINSVIAHHFSDLAYNPFLLVFFAIDMQTATITESKKLRNKYLFRRISYARRTQV